MSTITHIVPIGLQDVWDIEVETNHSYIAQGFVNHNSSSSPNLQNIPKDSERRKCFIAAPGKKLVLYDYSGQEPKLIAYVTKDPVLTEFVNSEVKFYIAVTKYVYGIDIKKGTDEYDQYKSLELGLFYGLTPWGYARDTGLDLEEAKKRYALFFEKLPVAGKWVQDQQKRNPGFAKSILGRKMNLHPYSRDWKNNILNDPFQGSGGDMIKLAMKRLRRTDFYKKYHPEGKVCIILQVHDEILCEVDADLAPEWDVIQKQVMIETAEMLHPGIKGAVSGGIIDSWDQKE